MIYKPPYNNKLALQIWKECNLPTYIVSKENIEHALWIWIEDNNLIVRCEESKENARIQWKSNSCGTTYNWTWSSFIKWFICACGDPIDPSAVPQKRRPSIV